MRFILTGIDENNNETRKNGGGRVMFYLAELLKMAGYEAVFNTPPDDEDIVVYPDCITDNRLNAKRIVHYMLYFWTGPVIPKEELVFVYDCDFFHDYYEDVARVCYRPPERMFLPNIEPNLFHVEQKTVDSVLYLGKQTCKEKPDKQMVILDKDTMSRAECAALLRRTRAVYSLDHYTVLMQEAQLCGCATWHVVGKNKFRRVTPMDITPFIQNPERDVEAVKKFAQTCIEFFKA